MIPWLLLEKSCGSLLGRSVPPSEYIETATPNPAIALILLSAWRLVYNIFTTSELNVLSLLPLLMLLLDRCKNLPISALPESSPLDPQSVISTTLVIHWHRWSSWFMLERIADFQLEVKLQIEARRDRGLCAPSKGWDSIVRLKPDSGQKATGSYLHSTSGGKWLCFDFCIRK